MELKEGMYVRTTTGRIFKIIEVENKNVFYSCNPPKLQWQEQTFIHSKSGLECSSNIVKASNNIIDLIEVGDYVNGFRVDEIGEYHSIKTDTIETYAKVNCSALLNCFYEEDIKTVVTKEQIESMSYKVGE